MVRSHTAMRKIDLSEFLLIAEAVVGIPAKTLMGGYCRVEQALGALGVPFSGFGDLEFYPEPYQKAAAYCSALVRYHPLVDGNKRAAYTTMRMFIALNGYEWKHGREGQEEAARAVEALAANAVSEERFANWVGHRMERRS